MKVTKKLAAIGAAMIMAISTFSFTASANENGGNSVQWLPNSGSAENDDVSITGNTTFTTISGALYGQGTAVATNKTTSTRYTAAQVDIYDIYGVRQDQAYRFADAGHNGTVSSGAATAPSANCRYIKATGVVYNSPGTVSGGEYNNEDVTVYFIQ